MFGTWKRADTSSTACAAGYTFRDGSADTSRSDGSSDSSPVGYHTYPGYVAVQWPTKGDGFDAARLQQFNLANANAMSQTVCSAYGCSTCDYTRN